MTFRNHNFNHLKSCWHLSSLLQKDHIEGNETRAGKKASGSEFQLSPLGNTLYSVTSEAKAIIETPTLAFLILHIPCISQK